MFLELEVSKFMNLYKTLNQKKWLIDIGNSSIRTSIPIATKLLSFITTFFIMGFRAFQREHTMRSQIPSMKNIKYHFKRIAEKFCRDEGVSPNSKQRSRPPACPLPASASRMSQPQHRGTQKQHKKKRILPSTYRRRG